jgi:RNA polymerase sigma-70 factor (ECF subfamily)
MLWRKMMDISANIRARQPVLSSDTEREPMPAAAAAQRPARIPLKLLKPKRLSQAPEIAPPGAVVVDALNDEELFERAAKGERHCFEVLIGRYEDFLYGLLVRLAGGNVHRAEDFFQDTFLNALRAARTFDRKKAFKPWITAVAVNLVRDDARKRKVRGEVTLDGGSEQNGHARPEPAASTEGPGERAERSDEEKKVRKALERLTGLEREVVLLHFYNDMTLQETADALNAPLGTIKSRLHAALTRLSGILERAK